MARGWESKDIESQKEEAAEERRAAAERKAVSAEEVDRQRKQESLELTRTRVLRDLAEAKNERYREMLGRTLAHLEAELAKLAVPGGESKP